MIRPHSTLCALLILTSALGAVAPARAEDEPKETLVTRIYSVRALTAGRPDFVRVGAPRGIDDFSDEENPLFGAEVEEPFHPLGLVETLIELIRLHVEPESWDAVYGADLKAIGDDTLLVRAFGDVADRVADYLGALERQTMRTVAVELITARLTRAEVAALRSEDNPLLVEDKAFARIVTGARRGPEIGMLGYERHRFMAHTGSQAAHLADYDVEVAEKAKIADPIMSVHNLGLAVDVRPILAPDASSCLLALSAFVARMRALRPVVTGDELRIEAPDIEVASLLTKIDIPAGRWALIDGQQSAGDDRHWMFLVRVRPMVSDGLPARARGCVALESPTSRPARSLVLRSFDVAALAHSVRSVLGQEINLVPSNFTPPEPPELEDPQPIFPLDVIAELMTETVAPATWQLKGAMAEIRGGRLYVRNAPYVIEAVDRNLKTLRRGFLTSVVTQMELVSLPVEASQGLLLQVGPIEGERLAGLEAALASKTARPLSACRVTTMAGARNAISSGRRISYLADYEVEIASQATIANPVMQALLDGSVFDVRATETAGGTSVQAIVRFGYGRLVEPMRTVDTPHGRIETPEVAVLRMKSALRTPIGKTVVAAITKRGEAIEVLLLRSDVAHSAR